MASSGITDSSFSSAAGAAAWPPVAPGGTAMAGDSLLCGTTSLPARMLETSSTNPPRRTAPMTLFSSNEFIP